MAFISKIEGLDWCGEYLLYLENKQKGVKKEAKKHMDSFFYDFLKQKTESKRFFIDKVNQIAYDHHDFGKYLPYDLYNKLFKPEIEKWIIDESLNPIPLKWSYDFELLKKALMLNPLDQTVLHQLFTMLIARISMNQHEIKAGFGYEGNPKNDIEEIDFIMQYIDNILNSEEKNRVKTLIDELRESAVHYLT